MDEERTPPDCPGQREASAAVPQPEEFDAADHGQDQQPPSESTGAAMRTAHMGEPEPRRRGQIIRAHHLPWLIRSRRKSPSAPRRRIVVVLALAMLVATLTGAGLVALAFPSQLKLVPFALLSASTRSRPAPTATLSPNPSATQAAQASQSPQGCVDGIAPAPGQGPLGPIYTARRYAGVGNEVALTFDDGPNPTYTPQILATLKAAGVHATFFVVGHHVSLYPELVQQEWQDGNAIGNHTFAHEWIPGLSREKLQATLDKTTQAIRDATGDSCVWLFRPPYGDLVPPVKVSGPPTTIQVPVTVTRAWQVIHSSGYTPVDWDTDGHDWLRPGANVIAHQIIGELHPGAIILMHDGAPDTEKQDRSQTVAALPAVLDTIRARGLVPVTLPQLLYDAGLVKRPGAPTPTPPVPSGSSDGTGGFALLLSATGVAEVAYARRHLRALLVRSSRWGWQELARALSGGRPCQRAAAGTGRDSRSP